LQIVYSFSIGGQAVRALAALTDFKTPEYLYELLLLGHTAKQSPKIEICFHNTCSQPHRLAHSVHVQCWKLVRSYIWDENINTLIYKLARSTYKLFEVPKRAEDRSENITDFTQTVREQGCSSDVGQFLNFLSRLPVDVQLGISAVSTRNPLSAAIVVCKSSTNLLHFLSKHGSKFGRVTIPLNPHFKSITAQWIRIYGHTYLSCLESGEAEIHGESINRLPLRPIRGIKFSLGLYGVQALKLIYIDDTDSAWLGNESGGWIGAMYGKNVTDLLLWRDV
jgi:hypothetical protein